MSTFPPNTKFGPYHILRHVGPGAIGDIYEAMDELLGRKAMLKIIPHTLLATPETTRRFRLEVQTLGKLSHPNVLQAYTAWRTGEYFCVATECVEGKTLSEVLASGPIALADALSWFRGMANGVRAAHAAGVVHRGLKPSCILIQASGIPKLVDFGLAKPFDGEHQSDGTTKGLSIGTVDYLAPEVIAGAEATVRTDIYALGLIFFEMLTGRQTFSGATPFQKLALIREGKIPSMLDANPEIPASLDALVQRMSHKEPQHRHANIDEVLAELDSQVEMRSAA